MKLGKLKTDVYLVLMNDKYEPLWVVHEDHPQKDALCLNHRVMHIARILRAERMMGKERVISIQQITPKPKTPSQRKRLDQLEEPFPLKSEEFWFDEMIKEYAP